MTCARIVGILAAIAMTSPAFCDEFPADPIDLLLERDLVVEGVIIDREYVEASPRSLFDWAQDRILFDSERRSWRDHGQHIPSSCRLGVRVVETFSGESADLIEVDLWFLDRETCSGPPTRFSESLTVGSRHLFLLDRSSDGRWVPETWYWRISRNESDWEVSYDAVRSAAEHLAGIGYSPRDLRPIFVSPPDRPPDIRPHLSYADD